MFYYIVDNYVKNIFQYLKTKKSANNSFIKHTMSTLQILQYSKTEP